MKYELNRKDEHFEPIELKLIIENKLELQALQDLFSAYKNVVDLIYGKITGSVVNHFFILETIMRQVNFMLSKYKQ